MRLPWIKIGSRIAVLLIFYLLLSIPNSRFQYFSSDAEQTLPASNMTDKLVTNHISEILTYSEEEKSAQYDSLISLLSEQLAGLRTEILNIDDPMVEKMVFNLGLATAIGGLSVNDPRPLLENLWLWRQYLKQQSLFWDIDNEKQKLLLAYSISFISICEDFIVVNQGLVYTKISNQAVSLARSAELSNLVSGDMILSSTDVSYSFIEQAKMVPELTPSLGLILITGDSTFYISASPKLGLKTVLFDEYNNQPFARRMHLRLRNDIPELISNPAIPHRAANFIYDITLEHTINYDFTINLQKRVSLSELGLLNFAFEGEGLDFIASYSPLDKEFIYGIKRLGIKNESSASVSEIEYYPSVEVVGLQLSAEGIKSRNLEMASSAAGLTTINEELMNSLKWRLPYYRVLKGYSHVAGMLGTTAVMQAGMAPETAIINNFISSQNKKLVPLLAESAAQFENEYHYFPTYAMLREMAMANLSAPEHK